MNQQLKTINSPAVESLYFGREIMDNDTADGPHDGSSWDVQLVTDMLKFAAFIDESSGELVHGPGATPIPGKPTPKPPPRPPTPYPHPEPDSEGLTFPEAPEPNTIRNEQIVTALVSPTCVPGKTPPPTRPQPPKPAPENPRPITRPSTALDQDRLISTGMFHSTVTAKAGSFQSIEVILLTTVPKLICFDMLEPMSPNTGKPNLISEGDNPRPRPRPGPLGPPPGPPPDYPPPPVPIPNGTKQISMIDSEADTHEMAINRQQTVDFGAATSNHSTVSELARSVSLFTELGLTANINPETSRIEIAGRKSSRCSPCVVAPQNAFKVGSNSEVF